MPSSGKSAASFDKLADQMQKLRTDTQFSEEMGADGSLRRSANSMDLPASVPRRPRKDRANPVDRDSVLSTGEAVVVRHHQKKSRSRQQNTGAYRFTALLQKMQRWKTHVTAAVVELEKPFELPSASSDPAWCQGTQDACWGTTKVALEEIQKGSANIIAIIKYSVERQGAIDYANVEKRLIRILKQIKPLVTAMRTVAALDDSPGLGKSMIRRTKTICRAITNLMQGLETSASDVKATMTKSMEAVKELNEASKIVHKKAQEGVAQAHKNQADEKARWKQAREYEKTARRKKKAEMHEAERYARKQAKLKKVEEIRLQREEAEKLLIAARKLCMTQSLSMADAIERARQNAEKEFLLAATTPGSKLRAMLMGDDFDPTTTGFEATEENVYETGTAARAGFSTDNRSIVEQTEAMEAKKNEYIARLRRAQEQAVELYEMELSKEGDYETTGARAGFSVDSRTLSGKIDDLDVFENEDDETEDDTDDEDDDDSDDDEEDDPFSDDSLDDV